MRHRRGQGIRHGLRSDYRGMRSAGQRGWDVEATTGAVSDLADQLTELGVEMVTVESTSDYWRIWYYLLRRPDSTCSWSTPVT